MADAFSTNDSLQSPFSPPLLSSAAERTIGPSDPVVTMFRCVGFVSVKMGSGICMTGQDDTSRNNRKDYLFSLEGLIRTIYIVVTA
jgi:hypothetical protein